MSKVEKTIEQPWDDSVGFQHSEDVDAYFAKLNREQQGYFLNHSQPRAIELFDEEEFIGHSQRLNVCEKPEVVSGEDDEAPPKDIKCKDGTTQTDNDLESRKLENSDDSDVFSSDTDLSDESGSVFCLKIYEMPKKRKIVVRRPHPKQPRIAKPRFQITYRDESPEKVACVTTSSTLQTSQVPLDLSSTRRDTGSETPKPIVARRLFDGITLSSHLDVDKKQGDKVEKLD
jgi:hypothetical protein